ncbi:MAG: hypothetical protein R3D88_05425 [Alphaproteobacteria bacterium]
MSKKTYTVDGIRIREFTSISRHLDDDFVELLLAEARKRASKTVLEEDIMACKNCEVITPKLIIP